jgi:hypothetical protein
MRRLLPVLLAAVFLAVPTVAEAAPVKVVDGSAHKAGGQVKGWFAVAGIAKTSAPRVGGRVIVDDGRARKALGTWTISPPRLGKRRRVTIDDRVPGALHAGEWRIDACTGGQCLRIGHFWIVKGSATATPAFPGGGAGGSPTKAPISTVPTAPISHPVGEPFKVASGGVEYWAYVPHSYDPSNLTPSTLFLWLHGCEGEAQGDTWVVDPEASGEGTQDWLTLSLAGREGGAEGECWVPRIDEARVLAALADFETHFNVNRQRVVLGGYSSGGDLAYRTGFFHSSTFAELLIENSAPFRDTEASQAELLGAATTKFHIVHLAHTEDKTYELPQVQGEVAAVRAAGFPIELIERPGGHSDSHTDEDLRTYLLPHIDDGWLAPPP